MKDCLIKTVGAVGSLESDLVVVTLEVVVKIKKEEFEKIVFDPTPQDLKRILNKIIKNEQL